MIPFRTSNYLSEMALFLTEYPTASAFVFPRYRAEMTVGKIVRLPGSFMYCKLITATRFHEFSLEKSWKSLKISKETEIGKSVLIPGRSETAWLHWPGLGNESSIDVPSEKSLFLHLRNWHYLDDYLKAPECGFNSCYGIEEFDVFEEESISEFSTKFYEEFQNNSGDFQTSGVYSAAIDECYGNFRTWFSRYDTPIPCVTPISCPIPRTVEGFSCLSVHQHHVSKPLGSSIVLHIPQGTPVWSHNSNGCRVRSA